MIQFPFTAIVGMEQAKKSLIYHAIDPRIGGTLFLGHRGCAKSTLVRAFAEIFQSTSHDNLPFVEVPLGTTEDRLLGSVNAETLVEQSKWRSRAGLIEDANGGVLYIDEINLLPDHLADFILDSAASGRYRMERDGITRIVESRYILVGTMNPEEGDLRPQLSDRFAHGVRVQDDFTPAERMEIVQRRIQFDDDPENFVAAYAASTSDLKNRVMHARQKLKEVHISHEHRMAVAAKGEMLNLEGVRAELAVVRTARCAAAWDNRAAVEDRDLARGLGSLPRTSRARPALFANALLNATRRAIRQTFRGRGRAHVAGSAGFSPQSRKTLAAPSGVVQRPPRVVAKAISPALGAARQIGVRWFFGQAKRPDRLARIGGIFVQDGMGAGPKRHAIAV